MRQISFFVPGKPAPGGSKRAFVLPNSRRVVVTEDNKLTKPWATTCKLYATANYAGPLWVCPISIQVIFQIERPKNHYRTGKNAAILKDNAPKFPITKPDCTKLMRPLEDALTKVIWLDDSQIVKQNILKVYDSKPGAVVTIREITG